MVRTSAVIAALLLGIAPAKAAEVVFKGAMLITSTSGCTSGWNPVGEIKEATYWLPIAGSSNGNKSVITLREGTGAEGFATEDGVFTSSYKTVNATHVGTLTGTYTASLRMASQSPAKPVATTNLIRATGTIKGFDFRAGCTISFDMSVYRIAN